MVRRKCRGHRAQLKVLSVCVGAYDLVIQLTQKSHAPSDPVILWFV